MKYLVLLVIIMAVVTYIPRAIPMIYLNDKKLPPFLNRFLKFIPFAALGALIFPQIIYSTDNISSALFGSIVAVILAYFRSSVIIVVFGAILSVYIFEILCM